MTIYIIIGIIAFIIFVMMVITINYLKSPKTKEKRATKKQYKSLTPLDTSDQAQIIRAHYHFLRDSSKSESYFKGTESVDENILANYNKFTEAFKECLKMIVWQVDSVHPAMTSSQVKTVVKKNVTWCMADNRQYIKPCPCAAVNTLYNGAIYFFPKFILHYTSGTLFEIWTYDQVQMQSDFVRFQEPEYLAPKDSEILGRTWEYVNKSGGPDRRYTYNPELLILKYGSLTLNTPIGTITYYTSKYDCIVKLVDAYTYLQNPHYKTNAEILNDESALLDMQKREENQKTISMQPAYYEGITQAVKNIYEFADVLIKTTEFYNVINTESVKLNIGEGEITNPRNKCITLLWTDMILGHLRMGHIPKTEEAQGYGLLLFFYMQEQNGKVISYSLLGNLKASLHNSCDDVIKCISDTLRPCLHKDGTFQTLSLLKNCPDELIAQFKVLMYRYFSLTAKADGTVTEKESKFLADIMRIGNESKGNVKIKHTIKPENNDSSSTPQECKKQDKVTQHESGKSLEDLKSLIGLSSVKDEIETLTNFIKIQQMREKKGLKSSSVSYHCVFTGNPGTGKTTVARIVAGIYHDMGILKKGHLVETDRSGLVAEYVGQTAIKTNKIIDTALDGVLFIDEAYSLVGEGQDFGKEAIATLLKRMEDDRDRLVVILAGYTNEIKQFIDTNPGLQSRFNRYIEFSDYSADELFQIFELSVKKYDYVMTEETQNALHIYLDNAVAHKDKNFGNGRFVRNIFEKTLEHQADRLAKIGNLRMEDLMQILPEDLPK